MTPNVISATGDFSEYHQNSCIEKHMFECFFISVHQFLNNTPVHIVNALFLTYINWMYHYSLLCDVNL